MAMSSRSVLFLRRGGLSKSAPASVAMSICDGISLPFCPLALSRKSHVSSTTNYICSCEGVEPVPGGEHDCG